MDGINLEYESKADVIDPIPTWPFPKDPTNPLVVFAADNIVSENVDTSPDAFLNISDNLLPLAAVISPLSSIS